MISFHHLLYLFIKVSSCASSIYSRVLVFDLFVRVTPCAVESMTIPLLLLGKIVISLKWLWAIGLL